MVLVCGIDIATGIGVATDTGQAVPIRVRSWLWGLRPLGVVLELEQILTLVQSQPLRVRV